MKSYTRVLRYYSKNYDEWEGRSWPFVQAKLVSFCNVPFAKQITDRDYLFRNTERRHTDVAYAECYDKNRKMADVAYSFMNYINHIQGEYKEVVTKDNQENLVLCDSCNSFFIPPPGEETMDMPDDMLAVTKVTCMDCVYDMWTRCGECGDWIKHEGETAYVNWDSVFCHTCADKLTTECPNCERRVTEAKAQQVKGIKCCDYCVKQLVKECTRCGEEFLNVNRQPRWRHETEYCDKCLFERDDYSSHMYKPNNVTFHIAKTERRVDATMFFGLELEFEIVDKDRGEVALSLKNMYSMDEIYLTHDGSLDFGLEAVLMPFSKLWYKDNKQYLSDLYSNIIQLGCTFDKNTVGTHIHTSKAAWTAVGIYKLVNFLYNVDNHRQLVKIYHREETRHSQFRESELQGVIRLAKDKKNIANADHYNMVNLSCKDTLEFRMFGNSSSVDGVFNYIDFVQSVHEFVNEHSISYMQIDYYKSFLDKQGKKYQHLLKELEG
jgi:hypothetical protein